MERFNFITSSGVDFVVECESKGNSKGFYHKAKTTLNGKDYSKQVQYYNKTWESFDFESVLYSLFKKMFVGTELEFMEKQLKDIRQATHDEYQKWFDAFKQRYDALSDNTKKHLANSGVVITSKEQAEQVIGISEVFDLLLK